MTYGRIAPCKYSTWVGCTADHVRSQDEYIQWAQANKFVSMLPRDTKCRKLEAAATAKNQAQLDGHLCKQEEKDCIVPYSDSLFHEAAIQWLVKTDQVCVYFVGFGPHLFIQMLQPVDAIHHKAFKYMHD